MSMTGDTHRPARQSWRFWRVVNWLADLWPWAPPCRICGGTRLESEWHRPRWRVTLKSGHDWVCFSCLHHAARIAGIVK